MNYCTSLVGWPWAEKLHDGLYFSFHLLSDWHWRVCVTSASKMAVPGTALPGTAAGTSAGALYFTRAGVQEGNYTATVYKLIAEQKFADAAQVLALELQSFPRSRAALSLLAFCYYHMQVRLRNWFSCQCFVSSPTHVVCVVVCRFYSQQFPQDYRSAALTYEQLVRFHPEVEEYKLYLAQSLHRAGL